MVMGASPEVYWWVLATTEGQARPMNDRMAMTMTMRPTM
jgi:hypothetical protein